MANLQIKNVPEDVHDQLRRRAEQRGISQRDYVLELIRRDQALPTQADWQAELRRLPRATADLSTVEVLHEAREEREEQLLDAHLRRIRDR